MVQPNDSIMMSSMNTRMTLSARSVGRLPKLEGREKLSGTDTLRASIFQRQRKAGRPAHPGSLCCSVLAGHLRSPPGPSVRTSGAVVGLIWSTLFLISDRDPQCNLHCSRTQPKPICASDGRSYESMCEYQRAKCRDPALGVVHRGRCKDAGQSKCRLERAQALEQAKKPQEAVFVPECSEDGSFTQVQCHTYTGYCWCVTPDGKPISGSSVQNKTPVCSGSVTDKPLSQGNSGRKDDGSKPTPTMETQPVFDGDEITAPTLWIKHLVIKDSKLNNTNVRNSEKVHSCDQERQSALEEARQNPREGIVIPECAPGGLYKPVQCHQSTGYCWCVLVDTGRPLPGTSTRYVMPSCESDARAKSTEVDDPFKDRELPGCPEGKKMEFITSLLDALTTDMVQAINSAAPTGGGRFSEPDPSHTLEERVVHWYFSQLDSNSSNDINKREMKPFKRYVKKKAKPKKCARRFTDYCDLNKDKVISLPELKGCLGVSKEGGSLGSFPQGKRAGTNPFSKLPSFWGLLYGPPHTALVLQWEWRDWPRT
ncbi:SPARC-related modular calcium-binding protein 1 [Myotis brandtii]|uniref:SPARC-related modular calcium-binding protein 1 n=1 Tax=Myotis brandtii TaxID=109478 RepID=S7PVK1_MYOBR|nr:SPARC-related modular calcium-binding protein 1 [Myotis brandtii]